MDALLMMFSRDLKRLTFDCIVPYSKDDLLIVASPLIAFRLTNIVNDNNEYFSVKSIMTKETVFACLDFNKRCSDFAEIMEAKIERYFITKKIGYLFFDDEEQQCLKKIMHRNNMTASVLIYMRQDVHSPFQEVDFIDLNHKDHMTISRYLSRLRVMAVVKPDIYYSMYVVNRQESRSRFDNLRKGKDKDFIQKMTKKYPKLNEIKTKRQFKNYYRGLSKKFHPDVYSDAEMFAQINIDFELLKETHWYKSLADDVADEKQQRQEESEEYNIFLPTSGRKR